MDGACLLGVPGDPSLHQLVDIKKLILKAESLGNRDTSGLVTPVKITSGVSAIEFVIR